MHGVVAYKSMSRGPRGPSGPLRRYCPRRHESCGRGSEMTENPKENFWPDVPDTSTSHSVPLFGEIAQPVQSSFTECNSESFSSGSHLAICVISMNFISEAPEGP